MAEIGIAREDAGGFFFPGVRIAGADELLFYRGKRLEQELAVVTQSESVLTGESAGDLVDEDFSKNEIDSGGGLKIADGVENVRGEKIAVGNAAEFAAEVVMAKGSVARISLAGAAFAVGAEMSATTGR